MMRRMAPLPHIIEALAETRTLGGDRGWLGYTGDWLGYTGGLLDWAGLLDPPETWRRCGAGGEGDLARCGGTCIYLESETDTEQNRIEKLFLSLLLLLLTRI